jgi:hypothetical protein
MTKAHIGVNLWWERSDHVGQTRKGDSLLSPRVKNPLQHIWILSMENNFNKESSTSMNTSILECFFFLHGENDICPYFLTYIQRNKDIFLGSLISILLYYAYFCLVQGWHILLLRSFCTFVVDLLDCHEKR